MKIIEIGASECNSSLNTTTHTHTTYPLATIPKPGGIAQWLQQRHQSTDAGEGTKKWFGIHNSLTQIESWLLKVPEKVTNTTGTVVNTNNNI